MQDIENKSLNNIQRGKLTVFLGAAPGVGKTYAMLKTALDRQREGIDTVIGWIAGHGCKEIAKMSSNFAKIDPLAMHPWNKQMSEMDIDAIIARKPTLVLVDDLAHTNIPGSRHVRRFQDVEDLLNAGINIYTTLSIQHIESLNDVVAQITGILEKETVPDYIIEQAENIQLIDIPTEDLIKRFTESKIHVSRQTDIALRHFFRPGNIDALRELALRFTASKVDQKLSEYMHEHHITGPWPASSRVMVCVGINPFSADLIRAARRLANGFQAEWLAVHIETPSRLPKNDKEKDFIVSNMRLAEELGAKTISLSGDNLTEDLLEVAYRYNVTAIVVGKPRHSRLWELFHGAVVDKLIRQSRGINIYVIQPQPEQVKETATNIVAVVKNPIPWQHYLGGLLMTSVITTLGYHFQDKIEFVNIALLYQLPVMLSAFWWGRWPSYFTAVCSLLCFDFLFVPPIFTFTIYDLRFIWSFITFLIVAFVIGGRTELLRYEARAAHQRERGTHALFEFSREIAAVIDLDTIVRELITQVSATLDQKAAVFLPDDKDQLLMWNETTLHHKENAHFPKDFNNELETSAVMWTYKHKQQAGHCTNTLPEAKYLYIPLIARGNAMGVLGVHIVAKLITPEQRRLIDAWADLAAVAIERVKLAEKEREAALLLESERLRTALLNSVSHELKTPLSFIIGSTSSLLETETTYSEEAKHELLESIKEGANRMERIVANLLDTARIESGMMHLKNDWCDMEDIIGTALRRLTDQLKNRSLIVDISADTPLLRADCVLLEQVLINLLDNALKYSPPQSPIEITVTSDEKNLQLSVADHGIGIPEADLLHIFDKFYRVQQRTIRASGTGLGLSICKSIIEAHKGRIVAENRQKGGTIFSFSLPMSNNNEMLTPYGNERKPEA